MGPGARVGQDIRGSRLQMPDYPKKKKSSRPSKLPAATSTRNRQMHRAACIVYEPTGVSNYMGTRKYPFYGPDQDPIQSSRDFWALARLPSTDHIVCHHLDLSAEINIIENEVWLAPISLSRSQVLP